MIVAEASSAGVYDPVSDEIATATPPTAEGATVSAMLEGATYVAPNYTSNVSASAEQAQWFYAGASLGTVLRAEAIPGRMFYDFDGETVKDPFDVMESAGLNAVRVETFIDTCTGPSLPFNNSGDVLSRELNYLLDTGCIDIQVMAAELGKARNMKIILTVNFGTPIPAAWLHFNYTQMLQAIDVEVRRQVSPFLQAGIQPDIVLLENEGTAGFLFNVTLDNGDTYARGAGNNPAISEAQLQQETCGQLPTGYFGKVLLLLPYPCFSSNTLTCFHVRRHISSIGGVL